MYTMSGKRRLCHHCGEYVCKSTYSEHQNIAKYDINPCTVRCMNTTNSNLKMVNPSIPIYIYIATSNFYCTDLLCGQKSVDDIYEPNTSDSSSIEEYLHIEDSIIMNSTSCSESSESEV